MDRLVGLNITQCGHNIQLDQHLLVDQIISDFKGECYPKRSTLPEEALETHTGDSVKATQYRSILGSLMYLCSGTRPDLSYSVNLLARYSANPSEKHWTALDHLLGYLKRTRTVAMSFWQGGMQLWSDANWGGEHERSTSGFLVRHNGNCVAWGSKRQNIVALSTCAAEYVALSDSAQHLAHLNNLLIDIDHVVPLEIFCDNEAAILIAGDNASKKKTKCLSRAFYFINDFVRQYNINIRWTRTQDQMADNFTKRLGPNLIEQALKKLKLKES